MDLDHDLDTNPNTSLLDAEEGLDLLMAQAEEAENDLLTNHSTSTPPITKRPYLEGKPGSFAEAEARLVAAEVAAWLPHATDEALMAEIQRRNLSRYKAVLDSRSHLD